MNRFEGKTPPAGGSSAQGKATTKTPEEEVSGILLRTDVAISIWAQSLRSPTLDALALFFRSLVMDEAIFLGLPAFAWLCQDLLGVMFVLHQFAMAEVLNGIIKFVAARPRPFWYSHGVQNLGKFECHYSLPSSHAQLTAVMPASLVIWFAPSEAWVVLAGAVIFLGGVSRVYLGAHYSSDVVLGWALGVLLPLACFRAGVVQWFVELPTSYRYSFALHPFLLLGILAWARRRNMQATSREQIEKWTRNAQRATSGASKREVTPFTFEPYIFPACSSGGSALGAAFVVDAAHSGRMLPLLTKCSLADNAMVLAWRLLQGYAAMLPFGLGMFVVPALLRKRGAPGLGTAIAMVSSTALGLWLLPGNVWVAQSLWNLEC